VWVIVHVSVGLAIAETMPGPFWLVLLAVIASHLLLDLVPHWDYTLRLHVISWAIVDAGMSIAALAAAYALGASPWVLAMGMLSGFPDLDVVASAACGRGGKGWFPSHWRRFPHGRCGPWVGIPLQLAIVGGCLAIVAFSLS